MRFLVDRRPTLEPTVYGGRGVSDHISHLGKGVHSVGWINREMWNDKTLDEQAESIARKCIT